MIAYDSGIWKVFQLRGSVFPQALWIAFPTGVFSSLLTFAIYDGELLGRGFEPQGALMKNNAIWGGFTFLVGFLIVFRTSVAYSRFWEGCTHIHDMGAKWFDACSALVAFCKHCPAEKKDDMCRFQHTLVRLFSMMHAAALGDITDCKDLDHVLEAYRVELIDGDAIDEQSLITVMESDSKVELIFQWLQGLIVENINVGVLTIPAPILTRSFQDLGDGKESFEDALKVSIIPFPFPYAQTCDVMLLMHWLAVPFIVTQWMSTWWLAFIFAFVQVFTLWTLNLIAEELENPFGYDPNDIDSMQMQIAMNRHLRMLINSSTQRLPSLQPNLDPDELTLNVVRGSNETSFHDMWASISSKQGVRIQRRCAAVPRNTNQPGSALLTWASTLSLASRMSRMSGFRPSDARSSSSPHFCHAHSMNSWTSNKSKRSSGRASEGVAPRASDSLSLPSWPSRADTLPESPRSPLSASPMQASPRAPDGPPPPAVRHSVPRLPLETLRSSRPGPS